MSGVGGVRVDEEEEEVMAQPRSESKQLPN